MGQDLHVDISLCLADWQSRVPRKVMSRKSGTLIRVTQEIFSNQFILATPAVMRYGFGQLRIMAGLPTHWEDVYLASESTLNAPVVFVGATSVQKR